MSILKSEPAVTWTVLLWVLNSSMLDWGSSELAASLIDFSVTFLINTFFHGPAEQWEGPSSAIG